MYLDGPKSITNDEKSQCFGFYNVDGGVTLLAPLQVIFDRSGPFLRSCKWQGHLEYKRTHFVQELISSNLVRIQIFFHEPDKYLPTYSLVH